MKQRPLLYNYTFRYMLQLLLRIAIGAIILIGVNVITNLQDYNVVEMPNGKTLIIHK